MTSHVVSLRRMFACIVLFSVLRSHGALAEESGRMMGGAVVSSIGFAIPVGIFVTRVKQIFTTDEKDDDAAEATRETVYMAAGGVGLALSVSGIVMSAPLLDGESCLSWCATGIGLGAAGTLLSTIYVAIGASDRAERNSKDVSWNVAPYALPQGDGVGIQLTLTNF